MPSFYLKTYGCQMNVYDSARMASLLGPLNYSETKDPKQADLILFNTCTIREKAKHKFLSDLGRVTPLKKKKKDLIVGVTGCAAQEEGDKLLKRLPTLDMVLGVDQVDQLPSVLTQIKKTKSRITLTAFDTNPKVSLAYVKPDDCPTSANITIITGCDKFCSFCIVPFTRGLEKSRAPREIIREVEGLVSGGTKEIMLLGQNVNSYDYDKIYFPQLVRMVSDIKGLKRIRYTSPHPQDFDDDLIEAHLDLSNLCKHVHLPVQAGNDKVLELMRRRYTVEHYKERIKKVRSKISDIAISTDIIVGFPTETNAQFEDTMQLLEDVRYDLAYSFKYSQRSGTKAANELKDDVPEDIKDKRLERLQSRQDEISLEKNKALEGQVVEVLVEKTSKDQKLQGRTDTNKIVHFSGDEKLIGTFVSVKLQKAMPYSFLAKTAH